MPLVADYARKFGVYDDMLPVLSMALGAGETTLMRMTGAYAMIANGGRRVTPRSSTASRTATATPSTGTTNASAAAATPTVGQPARADPYRSPPHRARCHDLLSDHLSDGGRDPARHRHRVEGSRAPVAGKSGTTNEEKDAWFMPSPPTWWWVCIWATTGPSPWQGATGGVLTAPVVRDFMKTALADKPAIPFRVPPGIKLVRINPKTGLRAGPGENSILEGFKPGTAPPDSYRSSAPATPRWA